MISLITIDKNGTPNMYPYNNGSCWLVELEGFWDGDIYQNELQRVSIDAQKYQALVAAEVQTYQQEIAEKGKEKSSGENKDKKGGK